MDEDAETFELAVGESAIIRDDYVAKLSSSVRYKVMYTRSDASSYVWLDNRGDTGIVNHGQDQDFGFTFEGTRFSTLHWQKLT